MTLRRLPAPVVVIAALGILQLLLFWPGIASYDIVFVYDQWAHGAVGDWHPPVLIRLWSALMALGLHGTGPLFALQLLLFWAGFVLLAAGCALSGGRRAAWAIVVAGALPPLFCWQSEVVKDSQMIGALVLATGIVGWYRLRDRPLPRLAIGGVALALLYASLLRPNALFSTLPLAVMLSLSGADGRRHDLRAGMVGLLIVVLTASTPFLNHDVFRVHRAHAERSQMLFDMAGIAHDARLPTVAGVPAPLWAAAERRGCYTAFAWDSYSMPASCPQIWAAVKDRRLTTDWLAAIVDHPLAYLRHRIAHWNLSLRFLVAKHEPRGTTQEYSTDNPYGLGSGNTGAARLNFKVQLALAKTPLGWPFFWLALGIALLGIALPLQRSAPRDLALALALSGVVQATSLLFVSVAADLRYHAWPIAAVGLATALLIGEPVSRRRIAIALPVIALLCVCAIGARHILPAIWPAGF